MAEFYRFFDSKIDDIREYTADEFAEYFRMVLTSGIYNGGTNLQVTATNSNMSVTVQEGYALINGYLYKVVEGVELPLATADTMYDRIDRIVLRWDVNEDARHIKAFVLTGTPAEVPVAPAITREGNIYELSLAQVLVPSGRNFVDGSNVTDERLNTEVCGVMNSLIQADTTEIFNQFQAWYDAKTAEFEKKWNDWYSAQRKEGFVLGSEKGVPEGVATLDATGKVPLSQVDYRAGNATILDEGNFFTSTTVEDVLQDLGRGYSGTRDAFKVFKSGKDSEGIFTTVEYKRNNDTLAVKSVLSGGVSPTYTTRTITFYDGTGASVLKTITRNLTYDSDDTLISEV